MLSDEEKKAIQYLNKYCDTDLLYEQRHYNYIKMIIRLVGKQSKEIEELKEDKLTIINNFHENWLDKRYVEMMYVSKDKIKAKIEEANKIIDEDKDFINKFQNSVDANAINWYYQKVDLNVRIRNILESLLEKE